MGYNWNLGASNGPWTTGQEKFLIEHAHRMSRKRLCVELDRSLGSVHGKLQKLKREGRLKTPGGRKRLFSARVL